MHNCTSDPCIYSDEEKQDTKERPEEADVMQSMTSNPKRGDRWKTEVDRVT